VEKGALAQGVTTESTSAPEPYLDIEMTRPDGQHGLLLFSLFDQSGRIFGPPQHGIRERLAANPLWNYWLHGKSLAAQETAFQVQTFVSSQEPLSGAMSPWSAERETVERLFLAARQELRAAYGVQQREAAGE